MPEIIILSEKDLKQIITLEEVVKLVESEFSAYYRGGFIPFPVVREKIDKYEGIFGIKSGYVINDDLLGFKAGGYWKNNPVRGIPAHRSVVLLFDPQTGNIRAVMDGNFITTIRTGAVGAIAAKYLAKRDSKVATIIGCGAQGRMQLTVLKWFLPVKNIRCYDIRPECAEELAKEMSSQRCIVQSFSSPEEAVDGADVIVTTTPSESWIVSSDSIEPGMHISAMGADTKGKQEIDPVLFGRAKIVADSIEQCRQLGEMQHAPDLVKSGGVYAEIGEIITGEKPGRVNDSEITLFDATGIAFQDLVTAGLALKLSKERGIGKRILI
jgi:alanine dehydrogenase